MTHLIIISLFLTLYVSVDAAVCSIIPDRSPKEAALMASLSIEAASSAKLRRIDPTVVEELLSLMQAGEIKVFMRHGEQQKHPRVLGLSGALQKIEMMRAPDNRDNRITHNSSAEFIGFFSIWKYLKEKTGRVIPVQTSRNMRAAIPAEVLGTLDYAEGIWDCVDYPSEEEMPAVEILSMLPDGTLPWEREIVDLIVKEGTYVQITSNMQQVLSAPGSLLAITHTQQLNALALQLALPVARMGNFGFIVVSASGAKLFPNGLYK